MRRNTILITIAVFLAAIVIDAVAGATGLPLHFLIAATLFVVSGGALLAALIMQEQARVLFLASLLWGIGTLAVLVAPAVIAMPSMYISVALLSVVCVAVAGTQLYRIKEEGT